MRWGQCARMEPSKVSAWQLGDCCAATHGMVEVWTPCLSMGIGDQTYFQMDDPARRRPHH